MAKDSKSTFQIIDDDGCPVDPSIFPAFTPDGNALQSVYEAFRFTESYGVIFQCNVKYCLGPCDPVSKQKQVSVERTFVLFTKLIVAKKTRRRLFSFENRATLPLLT